MPAFLSQNLKRHNSRQVIHIGLLNNMPEAAQAATERQFLSLLDAASGRRDIALTLYSLPAIPRTDPGDQRYRSVEELLNSHLDGLIVTGTEPRHSNLTEEPYWKDLTKVIDWAENNTYSTVWSCLAAHAAVLHMDGILRHRLDRKCFGVFQSLKADEHELTQGLPSAVSIPHSRWHDIRAGELAARGYRILNRVNDTPGIFVKRAKSLFVFFQGHPEYETNTLLLEYRRDIRRYIRKERETYPLPPDNYFTGGMPAGLEELDARALQSAIPNSWRSTGTGLYRNWLTQIHTEKLLEPYRHGSHVALSSVA